MHLNLATDYGLRVLLYLSRASEPTPVGEIAQAFAISKDHLVKVVQQLGRLGYVRTLPGRRGGVTLARAPGAIDVGRVVAQLEGRHGVLACIEDPSVCVLEPGCSLRRRLRAAEDAFYAVLEGTTIADLVRGPRRGGLANLPLP